MNRRTFGMMVLLGSLVAAAAPRSGRGIWEGIGVATRPNVSAEGIAAPEAGEYKLFTSIYHESTSRHVQIAIEPTVNGISLGHRMPGGWILGRKGITSAVCQLGGYRISLLAGDVQMVSG